MDINLLNIIVSQFNIDISNITFKTIAQGYINDTFLVEKNSEPKYILQRINNNVFKNISGLHKNIEHSLSKLKAKDYSNISLLKTKTDKVYYIHNNSFWRLMTFIPKSIAHNITSNPKIAFEAGRVIGRFHHLLKYENLNSYEDTFPNLNHLPFWAKEFHKTLELTNNKLKTKAKSEIDFAIKNLGRFDAFYAADLPKRICHNDTKLNNFLFDANDKGLCLIDLDTIMEGYFHYDFGDVVRTVVSEANEDEKDLSKIKFKTHLFEALINGISSNGSLLNRIEQDYLPISCALMPFMNGLRALSDYLNGNIHYKVSYPEQNLDRCKSLFQFARLAIDRQTDIKTIIDNKL